MNEILMDGNVGGDPELRYTPNGYPIAEASLANSRKVKNRDGQEEFVPTWFKIKLLGKRAETFSNSVAKGDRLWIKGELMIDSWEDKETGKKQYKPVILVNNYVVSKKSERREPGEDDY